MDKSCNKSKGAFVVTDMVGWHAIQMNYILLTSIVVVRNLNDKLKPKENMLRAWVESQIRMKNQCVGTSTLSAYYMLRD